MVQSAAMVKVHLSFEILRIADFLRNRRKVVLGCFRDHKRHTKTRFFKIIFTANFSKNTPVTLNFTISVVKVSHVCPFLLQVSFSHQRQTKQGNVGLHFNYFS